MNVLRLDYNSPSALKEFLEKNDMAMRKKFGQNFLVNANARKTLVDALEMEKGTRVWEIGPGLGAMTEEILLRGANLTVFEIDRGFSSVLEQLFFDYERKGTFSLVRGDVLKTWKAELKNSGKPDCFFGNLPYNIAATLIGDTIEEGVRFDKMLVTVQKEVAKRILAFPGEKDYSSLSVLCQWAYDVKPVITLAGGNFWPRPNVDSMAVIMTPKAEFPRCEAPEFFVKLQRALFSLRRKTVKNNLSGFFSDAKDASRVLSSVGIDDNIRAERLGVEKLLALSDAIWSERQKATR
ncbi:ribosomal RNA small subunit methyltransferase A [Treponema parvum]|uniref:Ribosomal RNA small subunit methyltransferase A n=1 Tax=Treponema parvum TaxID=138851 RepID=A0A975IEM7_9SPIR|nr:16S rRNA (adenine(1518)-N(6)/adenine(1519)-N(6))-dimethyltransferase RsmA [Treponema parvum]QTQ13977.1 ribosomal RNA small subunit methyltransferase A [Treponema parvum]